MSVEHLTSVRLRYDRMAESDVDDVFAVYSDPQTWRHLPRGRFTRREQAQSILERSEISWEKAGCGQWAVRSLTSIGRKDGAVLPSGAFVGTVSATWLELSAGSSVWNLGYRLAPVAWGRGLATEAARIALETAQTVGGSVPVTARALTSNPASIRVLEHLGLPQVWRGASRETEELGRSAGTTSLERVIHSDRPLAAGVLAAVIALG